MHIRTKEQILELISSMKHFQDTIVKIKDISECISILESCQQAAIAIGNRIEQELVVDKQIVSLLEEYCEQLYQMSQVETVEPDSSIYRKLVDILNEVREHIAVIRAKYRVVFLPYKADMWDSLESIWYAFSQDDRFECDVVPIPYFEANRVTNEWEARYDGERFPSDVPITVFDYYRMDEMMPDIAFVHNPFDDCNLVTTVHPDYYSKELKKYVGKLVYVPYYVNTGFIAEDYQNLPSFELFDYIMVQSECSKESCKLYPHYGRVISIGSPKFDKVIRQCESPYIPEAWTQILQGKKVLMLNTTISDLLENEEGLIRKLRYIFELFRENTQVALIWRPHPLLEGTIKAMRIDLIDKYQELCSYFIENKIGIIDFTGDISNTVAISDGYIGSSYSSVINLFAVCGKPCYLLNGTEIYTSIQQEKKKAVEVFQKTDELAYFACYESDVYMIEDFLEDLTKENLSEVRVAQLEAVKNIAVNLDGTCGQKIHDFLVESLLR